MKSILSIIFIILFIPLIIINIFFIKESQIFHVYESSIIRIKREETDEIIEFAFEEYIIGVVSAEMPASFELDALKAQSVAARTYAIKKIKDTSSYDLVDTVMNQVYIDTEEQKEKWGDNYEFYYNKIKDAVLDTAGEYLVYEDEIIEALYFSTSSGYTQNSEDVFVSAKPYLVSVESSWDTISPVFSEENQYSLIDFYTMLDIVYSDSLIIEYTDITDVGRVNELKINDVIFSNSEFINIFDVRSSTYEVTQLSNNVIIKSYGYGHGVGMSQYGAQAMALEGYSYEEILKYYYQGVEIKNDL